ncbi:MAG: GspE/PulE family protein [bacterium]
MCRALWVILIVIGLAGWSRAADTVVFTTGASRDAVIVDEDAQSITLRFDVTGNERYLKSSIKEIRRDTVSGFDSVFRYLIKASAGAPQNMTELAAQYQQAVTEASARAQKEKSRNTAQARVYYELLARALADPAAKRLNASSAVLDGQTQTVNDNLAQIYYELGQELAVQPAKLRLAQDLFTSAARMAPLKPLYRFELARTAERNGDVTTAMENYQQVAAAPNVPVVIQGAAVEAVKRMRAAATARPAQPMPPRTPRAYTPAAPAATITAPQPAPAPSGVAGQQPATDARNLTDRAKDWWQSAQRSLASGEYTSYLIEYLPYIISVLLAYLFLWHLPRKFVVRRARRGDLAAAEARYYVRWLGIFALLPWVFKKLKSIRPKNACPFCGKSIDNINSYADLNFFVCPHCRENITPIYDLKDYITHLMRQAGSEMSHKKGVKQESVIERDAMLKLVRAVLTLCLRQRASDVHVDSDMEGAKVRARIDGMMYDMMALPKSVSNMFISAIKIMANLDITERRVPQDGKISLWIDKTDIDLRINTSPASLGEKVSIRILTQKTIQVDPARLGLEGDNLEKFARAIRRPHGLIIVTGPSGSGKSTTLYVALNEINTGDKNMVTIEDPIEYQLKGLSQMQVNTAANFTFSTGLRSILRQDPDVIMVGEIRDNETADIAIEAAMTGHLVFTTLHTIDAPTAFGRLADLTVETRRLSSAVILVMAQRLVRSICPDCVKPYKPRTADFELLGMADAKDITHVHGAGCANCMNTGYFGRIGIFEMLVPNDELREELEKNAPVSVIRDIVRKSGYHTLRDEGIIKIRQGITTVEEVIRVTS